MNTSQQQHFSAWAKNYPDSPFIPVPLLPSSPPFLSFPYINLAHHQNHPFPPPTPYVNQSKHTYSLKPPSKFLFPPFAFFQLRSLVYLVPIFAQTLDMSELCIHGRVCISSRPRAWLFGEKVGRLRWGWIGEMETGDVWMLWSLKGGIVFCVGIW